MKNETNEDDLEDKHIDTDNKWFLYGTGECKSNCVNPPLIL